MTNSKLLHDQALWPSEYLLANNGQYSLIMQGDGNLVLYSTTKALWSSGTQGHSNVLFALMQGDGNFVVYLQGGTPIWNSGTQNHPGAWVNVINTGKVVVYSSTGSVLWQKP